MTARQNDTPGPAAGATGDDPLYAELARPFEHTFRDLRGGVELEYVTGEQVVSRLNETLGFMGWSFRVLEQGIHAEADECWVQAELAVTLDGKTVTRQQFGSQKIKRSRSSGTPLDIGFDLKGAATDALKKCASQIGVGLYLWRKEGGVPASLDDGVPETAVRDRPRTSSGPRALPRREPARPAPAPVPASQAEIDQYEVVRAEAKVAGFEAPWLEEDPASWSSPQLKAFQGHLERHIAQTNALRKPAVRSS
jgi:hypothetical protein